MAVCISLGITSLVCPLRSTTAGGTFSCPRANTFSDNDNARNIPDALFTLSPACSTWLSRTWPNDNAAARVTIPPSAGVRVTRPAQVVDTEDLRVGLITLPSSQQEHVFLTACRT